MRYAVDRWSIDRWVGQPRCMFLVGARSAATDAAANNFLCNLWNPSGTRSLWVEEFSYCSAGGNPAALDPLRLCRTGTSGTAGSTVTPDLDNEFERANSPSTGVVLHLANFSVEPTIASPPLYRLALAITGNPSTVTWVFPKGIRVPPGSGLGLATTGAVVAVAGDVTFRFYE